MFLVWLIVSAIVLVEYVPPFFGSSPPNDNGMAIEAGTTMIKEANEGMAAWWPFA